MPVKRNVSVSLPWSFAESGDSVDVLEISSI